MPLSIFRKKGGKNYSGCAKQVAFIVGTGRCGTTILAQVLNAHSKICVPPEMQMIVGIGNGDRFYEKFVAGELSKYRAEDFIRLVEQNCPYELEKFFDYKQHFKGLSYPQENLTDVVKGVFDHICHDKRKEVFIEQTPWQGQRLDVLKGLFPDMKVIHVVRDGRDVAVSFARSPWWTDSVEENLLQWEQEVNAIHDFGQRNQECFSELRYEDLVSEPEEWLTKVLRFIGCDFEAEILDPDNLIDYSTMFKGDLSGKVSKDFFKWTEKKKAVFFKESAFAWKRNKDFDFSRLAGPVKETLEKFNYEVS